MMCYLRAIVLGGFSVLVCFARFGFGYKAIVMSVLFFILFMVSVIDAKTMRIPDCCNGMILMLGILTIPLLSDILLSERILGMLVVSVPMLLITGIIPGAFGGGDIKLMAAAGFLLGWRLNLAAFFTGLFSGGVYGTGLLLAGKAEWKDSIAFGPFLCLGIGAAVLFGEGF